MNSWREFEAKVRPLYIVLLFIVLILFAAHKEARADIQVEIGPTFLSGQFAEGYMLALTEEFDNKYSIGVGYIMKQEVEDRSGTFYRLDENAFVQAYRRFDVYRGFSLGLGATYFNATNRALGSQFAFSCLATYQITDHLSVNFRHYSNAGSATPNMGQDALTIGWRF
jgi:hypothetical protein